MVTIGMSIPKVPHDVPIEKDMTAAMTNTRKGSSPIGGFAEETKPENIAAVMEELEF